MNKKIVKVILISLLILESCFLFLFVKSYTNKEIIKTKRESKIDTNLFSMYIENKDTGKYEEYDSLIWPNYEDYELNTDKSICIDYNGNVLNREIEFTETGIRIRSNKALYCYLYFDVIKPDIYAEFTTEGVSGTPSANGYLANIECTEGGASWNSKYWRYEVSNLTNGKSYCNIDFIKDNNSYITNYLNNYIKSLDGTTQGTGRVYNETVTDDYTYDSATTLQETDYTIIRNDSDLYVWSTNQWSASIPKDNINYVFQFSPNEAGDYELCYQGSFYRYSLSSGVVFKDQTVRINVQGSYSKTILSIYNNLSVDSVLTNRCVQLLNLQATDNITVQFANDTYEARSMNISLKKLENYEPPKSYKTGYRYQGKDPNNYIWFNNEMWRIIGAFDTKLSDGETTDFLTKIVRSQPIVSQPTNYSTIIDTLNNYYLYKKNPSACYGNSYNKVTINCNYENIGISKEYRNLIEEVTFNRAIIPSELPTKAYVNSLTDQNTVKKKIAFLDVVDLMFSSYSSVCERMQSYSTTCLLNSWLSRFSNQMLYSAIMSSSRNMRITNNGLGDISYSYTDNRFLDSSSGHNLSPVLYLKSNVYIVSGTGSITDPYIIAMN